MCFSIYKVLDSSQLLKDQDDVLNSDKVACLVKDDHLHMISVSSPPNNILHKIYEKTQLKPHMTEERALLNDRCLIPRELKMAHLLSSNNLFFIGERQMANLVLTGASMIEGMYNALWLNERSIFEYPQVRKIEWPIGFWLS